MYRYFLYLMVSVATICGLTACATPHSGNTYMSNEMTQGQSVFMATVEHIRTVKVVDSSSNKNGTIIGGLAGGYAGKLSLDKGTALGIGGLLGAAIGAVSGEITEMWMKKRKGYEITVRVNRGPRIVVVQELDQPFNVGDRVRIVRSRNGTTRITE